MTIIHHAAWLYHHFPLSDRDVQELLHQRGTLVSHETLREWCIKFSPLFADDLRQREPRRGSRWLMVEVYRTVNGVRHWLWRAVDEHGFVLDILLQRPRDTDAAKTFLTRRLGEYDVPEVIHTDKLWSYGAALRDLSVLHGVEHVQVVSTARCNNVIEHSHRPTRHQERQRASVLISVVLLKTTTGVQATETSAGIPLPARQHREPPPHPNQRARLDQTKQPETSVPDVVCGRGRGGLNLRPPLPSACHHAS